MSWYKSVTYNLVYVCVCMCVCVCVRVCVVYFTIEETPFHITSHFKSKLTYRKNKQKREDNHDTHACAPTYRMRVLLHTVGQDQTVLTR